MGLSRIFYTLLFCFGMMFLLIAFNDIWRLVAFVIGILLIIISFSLQQHSEYPGF